MSEKRTGAPCLGCESRTAVPNCHASCGPYLEYSAACERAREIRHMETETTAIRIRNAEKIHREVYRCTLKRRENKEE